MRGRCLVTLPVVAGLVLSGCSGSSDDSGTKAYAKDATFTLNTGLEDPGSFDPYTSQLIGALDGLAYDSLLNWQPDGTFASGLAEKWTSDVNGASFTLKEGVTCSDGSPLTARQVADALTYIADPKNGSSQYGTSVPTVPFTATPDDGARTVTISMSSPYGFVLNTIGLAPIVCAAGMKNPSSLKTSSNGTGPFELTAYQPGESMTFSRRAGYTWGPDGASTSAEGTPAKIVLKFITNETTAANLMLSGELNAMLVRGPERERLDDQGMKKVDGATAGQWAWFNQLGGRATDDPRVREALMTALDISQVVKVSTGGFGKVATGLIGQQPTVCPGNPLKGMLPKQDVSAAESLLDEAGWTKGGDGIRRKGGDTLRLDVHYVPSVSVYGEATAELLTKSWKAIGVDTELTSDTITGQATAMFETSDWDVYLAPFGANLPSQMVPYLSGPTVPNGTNFAGIESPDYDALVVKAEKQAPPKACADWLKAEQALYSEYNPMPISRLPNAIYLNKGEAKSNGFKYIATSLKVLK